MGRRSNFKRRPMDKYETPYAAVLPLLPFLGGIKTFAEPCAGTGKLVSHLTSLGLRCAYEGDISNGKDALNECIFGDADVVITNFPWTRRLLHPLLDHMLSFDRPIWMLLDADWLHTIQSEPYMPFCSHIVSVGRVKWIEGSDSVGKDNSCWIRLHSKWVGNPPFFVGRVVGKERWLPITGSPPYEISDYGRVRKAGHIIVPTSSQYGHLKVMLSHTPRYIHRLMLEAFIGPAPAGHQAAHGDGFPAHNYLANLSWKTPKENNADKLQHGTHMERAWHASAKLSEDDVAAIRSRRLNGDTQYKIAADLGVTRSTIAAIDQGRSWKPARGTHRRTP